ncbi:MAG: hypothetical protein CVV42_16445 [Candidatus Riflebacteria bacterium HGW-Riflebacteria-2]|jgi:hypothetical protein|nr:MAG: hypothetical protein CVV42_16445 [Candidatus Riflebacteria bacterium HGW-Riflebacteria-2]
MKNRKLGLFAVIALVLCVSASVSAVTPEFAALHQDRVQPTHDVVLKKILFVCGQINALYHGTNDMVGALQLAKNNNVTVEMLSAQLLAVKIGLTEKPALIRHIAREIEFCEVYPGFPLGFDDSPEGPEKISVEFYKMADHIENLRINHQLKELPELRKEAQRVVFELFWTDSEKMRTLASDMLNFLRMVLKEDIPFHIFGKPIHR